jgi:hypothetical protein
MSASIIEELEEFLRSAPSEGQLREWMKQLAPQQYAECALYLHRQGPTGFVRLLQPEYTYPGVPSLADEELFIKLAEAISDNTEFTAEGKIGMVNPRSNAEPINRFGSLFNEAVSRGFSRDDIGFGMQPHLRQSSKLSSISDPDWQRFEQLVARIYLAYCRDADVNWSEKLIDNSGTERQVDVTIRAKIDPYAVLGIVECKYKKRPASISDVEALVTKKRDLNAGFAVMVSRNGFQDGAVAKGRLHDVRLWTLEEASRTSWREEFRTFELKLHMFDRVEFKPPIPADAFAQQEYAVEFDKVTIAAPLKQTTLAAVLAHAMQDASQRCLPLPCWYDVEYPDKTEITLRGEVFPLAQLQIHFSYKVPLVQSKRLSIPLGTSFAFKKEGGNSFVINERDLPPLKRPTE